MVLLGILSVVSVFLLAGTVVFTAMLMDRRLKMLRDKINEEIDLFDEADWIEDEGFYEEYELYVYKSR